MTTLIIEHLKASELPAQWAQCLQAKPEQTVTVHIQTEPERTTPQAPATFVTDDPAFGIWRDREDMTDVQQYLRQLRAPRYHRDGSPKAG